jgi:nitrogenase molybdenum-iron protein beta chain
VFSNKPDFLIGNSYGKFIQRDTLHKGKEHRSAADPDRFPAVRPSPPAPRHHPGLRGRDAHSQELVNAVMERLDQETMILGETDYAFDLIR